MRLAKDALVFSKHGNTMSIGFLSQSYLEAIHAQEVLVPIISYWSATREPILTLENVEGLEIPPKEHEEKQDSSPNEDLAKNHKDNLRDILKYSIFHKESELFEQFDLIDVRGGTRIVLFNLTQVLSESDASLFTYELDYCKKEDDIVLDKWERASSYIEDPPETYSLRSYLASLYYDPKMQIWIKGTKVLPRNILTTLWKPKQYFYRPKNSSTSSSTITLGFNKINPKHCGMMFYHRGRLIKIYARIGIQLDNSSRGRSVLGVVLADFLKPTHNKQDFVTDDSYRLLITSLKEKLLLYWYVGIDAFLFFFFSVFFRILGPKFKLHPIERNFPSYSVIIFARIKRL